MQNVSFNIMIVGSIFESIFIVILSSKKGKFDKLKDRIFFSQIIYFEDQTKIQMPPLKTTDWKRSLSFL